MSSTNSSQERRALSQSMTKMTRDYIERMAAKISKHDGVITNQDVWDAHRYLKVPQDQVRLGFCSSCRVAFSTNTDL
jgi:hypothetical protein